MQAKVNSCYDYFKAIQIQREKEARFIIRTHCRRYLLKVRAKKKALAEKKAAAALKKAEEEKKRKQKYGYGAGPKKKTNKKPTTK